MTPEQVSIVGLVLAIGAAGLRKLWVFGWTYQDKVDELAKAETDIVFWRDLALSGTTLALKGTELAEKAATAAKR